MPGGADGGYVYRPSRARSGRLRLHPLRAGCMTWKPSQGGFEAGNRLQNPMLEKEKPVPGVNLARVGGTNGGYNTAVQFGG